MLKKLESQAKLAVCVKGSELGYEVGREEGCIYSGSGHKAEHKEGYLNPESMNEVGWNKRHA